MVIGSAFDQFRSNPEIQQGIRESAARLYEEADSLIREPYKTTARIDNEGTGSIVGHHALAKLQKGQIIEFVDKQAGEKYRPVQNSQPDDKGRRVWTVTDQRGNQRKWYGIIEAKKDSEGRFEITRTDGITEIATKYKANGNRETTDPGVGTTTERPGPRGQRTFIPADRGLVQPTRPPDSPIPTPHRPEQPRPEGGPVPQPGQRQEGERMPGPSRPGQPPPPEGGPVPQPRGGDGTQPRRDAQARPTPERAPAPNLDHVLMQALGKLFDILKQRLNQLNREVPAMPPVAPLGLRGEPRRLLGSKSNSDGSITYEYEHDHENPEFRATERLSGDRKVVERGIRYERPQSDVFQSVDGQPPIRLDNIGRSDTKLEEGTYTTTVTCIDANGQPVKYEFKTNATNGVVTKSPDVDQRPLSDLKTWTVAHIGALSPDLAGKLTAEQMKVIPVDRIKALTVQQIEKLKPETVAGMTTDQIKALSPTQFKALTIDQLKALTADQLNVLTDAQRQELTSKQADALYRT